MSEGPIKQWRDAHKPARVSIPDNRRKCARSEDRGYCGRKSAPLVGEWSKVTCPDCRAAYRADGGRLS